MQQTDLFIDGIRALDLGAAPEDAKPRLSRQALALLERLKLGPVMNREIVQTICLRYSARIADLRANGYDVECFDHDRKSGEAWYRLVK